MKTVWGLVFLALPVCLAAEEKKPVRVYTNEDLERVAPLRDQTGVNNTPAAASVSEMPAGQSKRSRAGNTSERSGGARGEEYWRREAERVRDRTRPLRQKVTDYRGRIEERRSKPKVLPYSDPQIRAWSLRIDEIEAQIREMESSFEDRARRAGAMPGWLR